VPDDRLLGAALELQRDRPRGIVVLLTGDVNLQTKAELVDLPFVELPPSTR
jgi:predicted ribonuclease YlaK